VDAVWSRAAVIAAGFRRLELSIEFIHCGLPRRCSLIWAVRLDDLRSTRALLDVPISQLGTRIEPPLAPAGRMPALRAAAGLLVAAAAAWSAVIVAHYMPMCVPL
jgi:hypothetical protein